MLPQAGGEELIRRNCVEQGKCHLQVTAQIMCDTRNPYSLRTR